MTGHTHSPSEWAAFGSLGLGCWAACAALLYLSYDAEAADFDPRPAVARAVASRPVCWLLNEVSKAHADVRETAAEARLYAALSLREIALTAAALLALLTINPGATR